MPCEVHGEDDVALFGAQTTARDGDVVLGEGRRIVFVDPRAAVELDLTDPARALMPRVLALGRTPG